MLASSLWFDNLEIELLVIVFPSTVKMALFLRPLDGGLLYAVLQYAGETHVAGIAFTLFTHQLRPQPPGLFFLPSFGWS